MVCWFLYHQYFLYVYIGVVWARALALALVNPSGLGHFGPKRLRLRSLGLQIEHLRSLGLWAANPSEPKSSVNPKFWWKFQRFCIIFAYCLSYKIAKKLFRNMWLIIIIIRFENHVGITV